MRRLLLTGLAVLFLIPAAPSYATPQDDAIAFVNSIADTALKIITSKDPEAKKQEALEAMFVKNVDIKWIGKFVLGRNWRAATPEQQKAYLDNYERFIIKNYTGRFTQYDGQELQIIKADKIGDGEYIVNSKLMTKDGSQAPVLIDYKLRRESKGFVVFDIIVEGVSLITTQRSEFASVVDRKGINFLIEALAKKANS